MEERTPTLLGPYELGPLLGKGGMSEVYKAFDRRLGRTVAAKRLGEHLVNEARERFRNEAQTLAQLRHPAIVQIFDIIEGETNDWIIMEFVDGPNLADLRSGGPLDVGLALDYGRQIASGIEGAHGSGFIHCDLKTENVMVLPPGHIKILDFGLSESVTRTAPKASSKAGTPRVMAPEQALGRAVDMRSDLFSFGVLLYEILTTRRPFTGGTLEETLHRVVTHQPPPVRQFNPKVPEELSELIHRLLEKDPAHRFQTAAAVEGELSRLAARDDDSTTNPSPSETFLFSQTRTVAPTNLPEPRDEPQALVTTLLVSELVGSQQFEELGGPETSALLHRHDRMARELLEKYSGRRIDQVDGFLMLFDRPGSAVDFALAYHQECRELGLKSRVGIHLGEILLFHNDPEEVRRGAREIEVEGLAKVTALRLGSLAAGRQTLITQTAYDVARRAAAGAEERDLHWCRHGLYRFRGLGEGLEVFEVGLPGLAPLRTPTGSSEVWRIEESAPRVSGIAEASNADPDKRKPVTLRFWPPPKIPEHPYPVLLPYTYPDFLAGRDQELNGLRRRLEMTVPILGLSAPSGTGKSSLLLGGLVPILRAEGTPVALDRYPTESGVAARLVGDLLEGVDDLAEGDPSVFVDRLAEVEGLSGTAPVLVLDQFEDVLRDGAVEARRVLGVLLAASVVPRAGLPTPRCRWLLAYRQEFFGPLQAWLRDVLDDARSAGRAGIEGLPFDLSQPEHFHSLPLRPLAVPRPGTRDALHEATQVFREAIEKPWKTLQLHRPQDQGSGTTAPFPAEDSRRLAQAFAEARMAAPAAPLVPELQVVLAHLLADAGPSGQVRVPQELGALIEQALEEHLHRALEAAFPARVATRSTGRARALLALRELATAQGRRREEGLRADELSRAIGKDGAKILETLATPLTRLVVAHEAPDGIRWMLAHDRMAEAVVRLVDEEGRRGRLVIDSELLALRRFITLRTALFQSGEVQAATRVSGRDFRRIEENAAALLGDGERQSWFQACRRRRRSDQRQLSGLVAAALVLLVFLGWGAGTWARRSAEDQALHEQVVRGEPEVALRALGALASPSDADASKMLSLLRQRDGTLDVLERGLEGLTGAELSQTVLHVVEIALPWVAETPEDRVLLANLVWALDFGPGRDPAFADQARTLRSRILQPLRERQPPPPPPSWDDPDWIDVPAGTFWMGTGSEEGGTAVEQPRHEVRLSAFRMLRHEVTNGQYRSLVSGHDPEAADELPAAFISWYAAYTYAAWRGGRLPTEAEWEYAARAHCPHTYCDREGRETTVDAVAWTVRNSLDPLTRDLTHHPVMQLEPNPWGFFDMLGNLWEWTADGYGEYSSPPKIDPWRPAQASHSGNRTDRGGYFGGGVEWVRPTARAPGAPGDEDLIQGFRIVLLSHPDSGNRHETETIETDTIGTEAIEPDSRNPQSSGVPGSIED